jgi:hypothetical protein
MRFKELMTCAEYRPSVPGLDRFVVVPPCFAFTH